MLIAIGNRQDVKNFEAAYTGQGDAVVFQPADQSKQLLLHSVAAYNNNSSACDIGVGMRLAPSAWKLYTLGVATTDVTVTIQAGTAVNLFDTTNNHGFYVQAKERFNMVSLAVSQAQTGSPVYEYTYWNGASWATLNLINTPSYASAGLSYIVFAAPLDWAVGNGSALSGTIQGSAGYAIRIRATTASSQAVKATAATGSQFFAYRGGIAAKQQLQVKFERPHILESGEGVAVYFGTANNLNLVDVGYQLNG